MFFGRCWLVPAEVVCSNHGAMRTRGFQTVVVGAGSAGTVVAARASERADHDVLLLEAGPDYGPGRALPSDLADGTLNSLFMHDWGLRHRPTPRHPLFRYPRGRVVGGSSAVNTCIALRGQPEDFDEWADLGLSEWGWNACLPYFKRLERDLDFDDPWHGRSGPLPIRRHPPDEWVPWQAAFLDACQRLGLPECADHNRPGSYGAGPHAMNKIRGRRISVAEAYLTAEVRRRPNLTVRGDCLVRRILFRGRRAVGVEFERYGVVQTVSADQVVVSAGAIATPGLLLRSGVGPRKDLDRLGVERVSVNEGVGARLLDHAGSALLFRPRSGVAGARDPLIQNLYRFRARAGGDWNHMQLQPGTAMPIRLPAVVGSVVSLMAPLGKPRSQASLRYPSADPRARPDIRSHMLQDPVDAAQVVEALELGIDLYERSSMRELAVPLWPRQLRRENLEDHVRTVCDSGYHPCGTVPMGPEGAPWAACDGRGRVRGTERLLVADASLMPTITSSNTNLPTIMIGERIGEWVATGET
jgi:choline dehydrogenase